MNRTRLSITSIINKDRQRFELGDITELAESIKTYGLIQPVVVNQNNILVAGGRRIAAHELLGFTEIDVVFKETLSEDYLKELEAEENLKRKDFTWQERAFGVETIHKMRQKRAALEGAYWGQRETGALLGIKGHANVNYALQIAEKLRKELSLPVEKRLYWQCENMSDAWKLRLREEQEALQAEMARRIAPQGARLAQEEAAIASLFADDASMAGNGSSSLISNPSAKMDFNAPLASDIKLSEQQHARDLRERAKNWGYDELNESERYNLFLSFEGNKPEDFERYDAVQMKRALAKNTINLSERFINEDCISFMSRNQGKFDHIITDPPYGIDMDMLNQGNDGHAFKDVDTVEAEHTVQGNEELFTKLFPAAYNSIKENGFFILWCDIMQWQRLYDCAIASGFKVQRWPITWVKLHRCMNQSAQFNFTKSTEIAMICRKGNTTLIAPEATCHILESHDDFKETLGHPFVKPFNVWKRLIEAVSIEGQILYEPFAGRGSMPISALRLNRNIIATESNIAHYNALLCNLQNHYLSINPSFTFV